MKIFVAKILDSLADLIVNTQKGSEGERDREIIQKLRQTAQEIKKL